LDKLVAFSVTFLAVSEPRFKRFSSLVILYAPLAGPQLSCASAPGGLNHSSSLKFSPFRCATSDFLIVSFNPSCILNIFIEEKETYFLSLTDFL